VPLFVIDDRLARSAAPARLAFLRESLADLAGALGRLGTGLVVRAGDPVAETMRLVAEVGADAIHLSRDTSPFGRAREEALRCAAGSRVAVHSHPGVTVVEPGDLTVAGGAAFRVFTPYWRRWSALPLPAEVVRPTGLPPIAGVASLALDRVLGAPATARVAGGETAATARLRAWVRDGGPARYGSGRDLLSEEAGSRLSAALHLGCIAPATVARAVADEPGAGEFLRQLAWRDFFHQLLVAQPELQSRDLRPGRTWRDDDAGFDAWAAGETGYPLVDAGMRQLAAEGWLPNRARLVTASFLTKHLGIDWRRGAAHYRRLLVDGDVAANSGNWQWAAGTGIDPRPGRMLNPVLQGRRYDPDGAYVRRWVPELEAVPGPAVHEPWSLPAGEARGYPPPIVDHGHARARFAQSRLF
jgi:deoxyribodipyrimidine photo-lyase